MYERGRIRPTDHRAGKHARIEVVSRAEATSPGTRPRLEWAATVPAKLAGKLGLKRSVTKYEQQGRSSGSAACRISRAFFPREVRNLKERSCLCLPLGFRKGRQHDGDRNYRHPTAKLKAVRMAHRRPNHARRPEPIRVGRCFQARQHSE